MGVKNVGPMAASDGPRSQSGRAVSVVRVTPGWYSETPRGFADSAAHVNGVSRVGVFARCDAPNRLIPLGVGKLDRGLRDRHADRAREPVPSS
jgi:hypothetical protein